MSKSYKIDLTGQRFGRLTVLEFVPKEDDHRSFWKCQCDCGEFCIVYKEHLIRQKGKEGKSHKTCKLFVPRRNNRLYGIWRLMRQRCNKPYSANYKYYGGRKISVCKEWENFSEFEKWALSNGYADNLTLDRIDVNGNYEAKNCQWISNLEQQHNKRNNLFVEYNGEKMCIREASILSGIPQLTLYRRYHRGVRGADLFRPVEK